MTEMQPIHDAQYALGATETPISHDSIDIKELKKSHKFDYVIVFDQEKSSGDNDDDDGTTCFGLINNGKTRSVALDRGRIVHRLRSVGLQCTLFRARNADEIFLGLTATEERLQRQAEIMKLHMRMSEAHGGGYTDFERDKVELFEKLPGGSLFRSSLRCHIVLNIVEAPKFEGGAELSLGLLQRAGIIKTMFPVHEDEPRKKLIQTWAKHWGIQPLDEIRDYFGEKIAIYFAWLGYYTTWLIIASIAGIVVFAITVDDRFDNPIIPFYCIFISLWSTLFLEFWKRRNCALAFRWGTLGYEAEERTRPEFRGTEKRGVYINGEWVDLSDEAKWGPKTPVSYYYSNLIRHIKIGFGTPAVLTMVCLVVAATVGLMITRSILQRDLRDPFWGGQLSGIINTVAILILNIVYRNLAISITDWENHRTDTEYEDNLISKTFMFQFVNSYISLFYIAYVKKSGMIGNDKCDPNCMEELSSQLSSILIFRQLIGQFQEILMPAIIARVNLYMENSNLKGTHEEAKPMSRYEKQRLQPEYPSPFDDYNEMIIQYGYVTLFVAAFPLAPAVALVNNIIEIRSDAFKILQEYRRPEYRAAEDIGTWYRILEVIGIISVITNVLVISETSTQLDEMIGEDNPKKVLFIAVAIEHAIFLVKFIIAWIIPDVPGWVRKELAQQEYAKVCAIESLSASKGEMADFSDDADSDQFSDISDAPADDMDEI